MVGAFRSFCPVCFSEVLCDFYSFELLFQSGCSVDLEQVLQLHALVHIEDSFFVALVKSLLLDLFFHRAYLCVPLRKDLVGQIKFSLNLGQDVAWLVGFEELFTSLMFPGTVRVGPVIENCPTCVKLVIISLEDLRYESVLDLQLIF